MKKLFKKFFNWFFGRTGEIIDLEINDIENLLIKKSCSVDKIMEVANDLAVKSTTESNDRSSYTDMVIRHCYERGFIKIDLVMIVEFLEKHNYLPNRWVIDKAIDNNNVLPARDNYNVLLQYPHILSFIFHDIHDNPMKYKNVSQYFLYHGIIKLKNSDYDWTYALTNLLTEFPNWQYMKMIIVQLGDDGVNYVDRLSKLLNPLSDIVSGKTGDTTYKAEDAGMQSIFEAVMHENNANERYTLPEIWKNSEDYIRETEVIHVTPGKEEIPENDSGNN